MFVKWIGKVRYSGTDIENIIPVYAIKYDDSTESAPIYDDLNHTGVVAVKCTLIIFSTVVFIHNSMLHYSKSKYDPHYKQRFYPTSDSFIGPFNRDRFTVQVH